MLAHRPRRWPNINLPSGQHLVVTREVDQNNVEAMLAHCLRRWPSIEPTLG